MVPPAVHTRRDRSQFNWTEINLDTPGGGDPGIHNVVFSSGSTSKSPDMQQFSTFSYSFTTPGTYDYFCAYHPGMKGTVTVTA